MAWTGIQFLRVFRVTYAWDGNEFRTEFLKWKVRMWKLTSFCMGRIMNFLEIGPIRHYGDNLLVLVSNICCNLNTLK